MAALSTALIIGIATSASEPAAYQSAEDGQEAIASIQDIMREIVDPSADALWAAVSSTVTASGTENRQPRTEDEWKAVRRNAVALTEAPNLLLTPGRRVAPLGGSLEDAQVVGILTPEEIAKKITSDRFAFTERVRALRDAAKDALSAIDARDAARLFEAGAKLDQACEACHVRYWYPNDTRPPPPANAKLAPRK
ncbi:cytochrome c [Methylosinus sp. LW4]|uniref:cytochrome c n=1 Tax=Methylosinus sp. LW4 TaxID=136993 RepID=UPI000378012B|nr:cytochrome c [Methylosinus sp. LW4]